MVAVKTTNETILGGFSKTLHWKRKVRSFEVISSPRVCSAVLNIKIICITVTALKSARDYLICCSAQASCFDRFPLQGIYYKRSTTAEHIHGKIFGTMLTPITVSCEKMVVAII